MAVKKQNYQASPIFSKKLNLRLKKDRTSLVQALQAVPNLFNFAASDIEASLEFVVTNLHSVEWSTMYPWSFPSMGRLNIRTNQPAKTSATLSELVNLGFKLSKLEKYKGFNKLLGGFQNPTQFHDTVFETDVAYYCHSCNNTKDIILSPQYSIRGKLKTPDLELYSSTGELVFECKNLHPQESGYVTRFQRIFNCVVTPMKTVRIPDDTRVNIHLAHAPGGNLTQWGNLVAETTSKMIQNKISNANNLGPFSIHIGPRHQRAPRPGKHYLVAGMVTIKSKPTPLTDTYLEMTADYFDSAIQRIIAKAIKKANSQLPKHKNCIIFLKTLRPDCAERAVDSRISLKSYSHVLAFGLWNNKIAFHCRLKDQEKVNDILGPLQFGEGG